MSSFNRVTIIGRVGSDPNIAYTTDGNCIAYFSVATNDNFEYKKENTEWHHIMCFGKLAEVCKKIISKGVLVFVEGKIKTSKWKDKETGLDRSKVNVIGSKVQFLCKGRDCRDSEKSDDLENKENQINLDEIPF